jgi:hypothetical protein
MSIKTGVRKGLAVVLLISGAWLGAGILDEISYRKQSHEFMRAIDARFIEQSLKVGAWAMDRECVAHHIGLDLAQLPSYQKTDENLRQILREHTQCFQQ